jgi:hypothetical protein
MEEVREEKAKSSCDLSGFPQKRIVEMKSFE